MLMSQSSLPETLYLFYDNHATQHNNAMMAFLEYLVRFRKIFRSVYVIFCVPHHGHNHVDQGHKDISETYSSSEAYNIQDLVSIANRSRAEFHGVWLKTIYNIWKVIEPCLSKYPHISVPHCFHIQQSGTTTKRWFSDTSEYSKWIEDSNLKIEEPHFFLCEEPNFSTTSLVEPQDVSDEQLKDLRNTLPFILSN